MRSCTNSLRACLKSLSTASRIPRVFFDAVFASAIAACFIPVFSEYLEKKGKPPQSLTLTFYTICFPFSTAQSLMFCELPKLPFFACPSFSY